MEADVILSWGQRRGTPAVHSGSKASETFLTSLWALCFKHSRVTGELSQSLHILAVFYNRRKVGLLHWQAYVHTFLAN
jgi:hypothetical protein